MPLRLFMLKSLGVSHPRTPLLLLLLACCLALPVGLRADHIVGGEFQYLSLGWKDNDPSTGIKVYRMYLNVYRDCIGRGACFDGGDNEPRQAPKEDCGGSSPMHITVYDGNQVFTRYATEELRFTGSFTDVEVNLGNPCLVLTEPVCQELYTYQFILELPVSDEAYTVAYQRCCRNESIRNIVNGNSIGATYFIQILPEAQRRENNSPRFNIFPPIAVCVNAEFRIDLGAQDNDGDSLVYRMCEAKIGAGQDGLENGANGPIFNTATPFDDLTPTIESPYPYTSVDYVVSRYDRDNQLGYGSELRIDPVSGELSGSPIYLGTHVIAICVEEWSRGPNPVLLSDTKREFQLSVSRCGSTVTADLEETELDDLGRFYIKQCGFGPNTIVNESTLERSIESYDWELTGPGGALITGSNRDLTTNINVEGLFEGKMFLNRNSFAENCKDTAIFLLEVFPGIRPDFESSEVLCEPAPIDFTDRSTTEGQQQIVGYQWNFGDGTDPPRERGTTPNHQYQEGGTFPVELILTDENGCSDGIVKEVDYFPSPQTIILEPQGGFGCAPLAQTFINLSSPINDDYLFDWQFSDGGSSADRDPTHTFERSGLYDVYLHITSPLGCVVDTLFRELVDVRDTPEAGFAWSPEQPTNEFPDFRVFDESIGANSHRYTIYTTTGEEVFSTPQPSFDYRLRDTNTLLIEQIVSHPSGCQDTLLQSLNLELVNAVKAPNAFTPNGDGVNDTWLPEGLWEGATQYQLRIWDRWGEAIFETNDFNTGWDGTHNGKNSPGGGYLWDLRFVNAQGRTESFKGGVVLIR